MPRYSQHISQLCLRRKITACSANEALASAMSFMPNQAASDGEHDPRHPDEGGVLRPDLHRLAVLDDVLRARRRRRRRSPAVMTSGLRNCTTDTPRLPRPGVHAQRRALALLREEEADVGHAGAEVAAAEAAQQRQDQHGRVAGACCPAPRSRCRSPGSAALAVEIAVQRRPPTTGTMNE